MYTQVPILLHAYAHAECDNNNPNFVLNEIFKRTIFIHHVTRIYCRGEKSSVFFVPMIQMFD